jgi:shikimate dehydrogenase
MERYGLIGLTLKHSFSQKYFREKFQKENLQNHDFELFELSTIQNFPALWKKYPDLKGVNVTVPYKKEVIQYLDSLSEEAAEIGAVNVIKKMVDGSLKGFNSDVLGFEKSLEGFLGGVKPTAMVLGTGGAAQAVFFGLKQLGIDFKIVSRTSELGNLTYQDLKDNPEIVSNTHLIVNASPVGTFPNVEECPDIPYQHIGSHHFLFDLVYNPPETLFLKKGKVQGAKIINGLEMLILQAEKAWEIWQKE